MKHHWISTSNEKRVKEALSRGARVMFVTGPGGIGKTTLLHRIESEYQSEQLVVSISLGDGDRETDVARAIRAAMNDRGIHVDGHGGSLTSPLWLMESVESTGNSPLLLLDGLDEAQSAGGVIAWISDLLSTTSKLQIIVTSRDETYGEQLRQLSGFAEVCMTTLSNDEVERFIGAVIDGRRGPIRPIIDAVLQASLVSAFQFLSPAGITSGILTGILGGLDQVRERQAIELLTILAVHQPLSASVLVDRIGCSKEQVERLLKQLSQLVVFEDVSVGYRLAHPAIRDHLRSRLVKEPVDLGELTFGAEDAERDELLQNCFVERPGVDKILAGDASIIIGDRGVGKSAIYEELCGHMANSEVDGACVRVAPLVDPFTIIDQLQSSNEPLSSADEFRAAWLLVAASLLATKTEEIGSKAYRRRASKLRDYFYPVSEESLSIMAKTWRGMKNLMSRSGLKFKAGPITLEPDVASSKRGGQSIDLCKFLDETDDLLGKSNGRVLLVVDRIDEVFKYDRDRQERLVQGLFLAESHFSFKECIRLVVMIRTDLFEIYDIQEKNKLVSRTIHLQWAEDEIFRFLIDRVFRNNQLDKLRMGVFGDGVVDVELALDLLFPAMVEGAQFRRWLTSALRDGRERISPRQIILFMLLIVQRLPETARRTDRIPLFNERYLIEAMTALSELAYKEVCDDFRMARGFVMNCRAKKITEFEQVDVMNMFEEPEGTAAQQLDVLERLGFLERIVEEDSPSFRIPVLFTRCWQRAPA